MFSDLLLASLTYPDATPDRAIRSGVALARRLDGKLTVMSITVDIPNVGNGLTKVLFPFERVAAEEEGRSARRAARESRVAVIAGENAGVQVTASNMTTALYFESDALVEACRTRDMCLMSIGPAVLADRSLVEAVIFGSGRPVLVFGEQTEIAPADRFETVLIAWDGGSNAARAVASALPILKRAERVRILVAVGEKQAAKQGVGDALARHLKAHRISSEIVEAPGVGQSIGDLLREQVSLAEADLLVMGAYGHTRLREFVLGGATDAMLEAPPCPLLLSH
jgi:nucleotide-binding universal stress UspA family protein